VTKRSAQLRLRSWCRRTPESGVWLESEDNEGEGEEEEDLDLFA
jgi:hypothetical protein